jgi:hypothetical protein
MRWLCLPTLAALVLAPLLAALPAALLAAPAWAAPPAAGSERLPAPPPARARSVVPTEARAPRAQSVRTSPETGLPLPGTRFTLDALHQFGTEVGAGLGDYTSTRASAELRVARNVSRRLQLNVEALFERGTYAFDDDAAVLPVGTGSLGGSYTALRIAAGGSWSLSRSFGVTFGGSLRSYWMDGADVEDGLQPGVIGAVRVRLFGKTDLLVGASITTGLEGDPSFLPVFGLSGFDTGKDSRWRVEARGPGLAVTYNVTPRLWVGASGGYERRDIRLADDDRLPGGVLRERRLPVGLEIGWQPRSCSSIILTGGASLWNKVTLLDDGGEVVLSNTTAIAPFVQLEWSLRL